MRVELRGTIRAALGATALEVDVPASGVPLSHLLDAIAAANPRARTYLGPRPGQAVLRPVHNGTLVPAGEDPLVQAHDRLLLIHAVAGG
ncbi:MAG: MoaD/ThiS family protein [Solirubrobacteraceae bacterium]